MIEELFQAECDLAEAHLSLDLERIDQLLHPDYVIVQPGGRVEGKAETMASLCADGRSWEIARSDEMQGQVYGDTAVVTGRWHGKGRNGDKLFDYTARFLSIWLRENGRWRNVAYQSTDIQPG